MAQILCKRKYEKLSHVNEEADPCLRTLTHKIRNYNKLLLEIEDITNRSDPNPKTEEMQKLHRKQKYQRERDRCIGLVATYRQILLENEEDDEAHRSNEIEDMAVVLTVMQSSKFQDSWKKSDQLKNLSMQVNQNSDQITLQEFHEKIKKLLMGISKSIQIKKMAKDFLVSNSTVLVSPAKNNLQFPMEHQNQKRDSQNQNSEPDLKNDSILKIEKKQEQKLSILDANETMKIIKQQKQAPKKLYSLKKDNPVDEDNSLLKQERQLKHNSLIVQPINESEKRPGAFKSSDKNEEKRRTQRPVKERKYRRSKRSNSRSKYQENPRDQPARNSRKIKNQTSSDSQDDKPQFNQEQIKELEEDGFIFVGKPKPKKKNNYYRRADFYESK